MAFRLQLLGFLGVSSKAVETLPIINSPIFRDSMVAMHEQLQHPAAFTSN